jgi:hypothetical protein
MQSMLPPSAPQLNRSASAFTFSLRKSFLALFLLVAALFALPSLAIGALVWRSASKTWDYRERWRGAWLFAIPGVLVYVLIMWFAHPLWYMLGGVFYSLLHGHLLFAVEWLGLIWLLHLFLAPACALILEGLHPMTKRIQLLPRHLVPPPKEARSAQLSPSSFPTMTPFRAQPPQVAPSPVPSFVPPSHAAPVQSSASTQALPLEPLGAYLGGDLYEWVYGNQLCLPLDEFVRHGTIIGEPGYGKTMTLLRLATIALHYGVQLVYLDLKGSKQTAALFVAATRLAGVRRIKVYPNEAYDGWRGDANALYNRLMAMTDPGTHPYYEKVTSSLVSLAVHAPGGPPRNSQDFLTRLDANWLSRAYAGKAQWYAQRKIKKLKSHIDETSLTYDGFFDKIAGGLDGTFALEDADAVYIGLDGDTLKEQAASMGRYLLEDCAHYAKYRKPRSLHTLVIIDEFGVLKTSNATDLYERMRESGISVYASAQSYQSLGSERAHILAASSIKIVHRCGDPEEIVKFAGQRDQPAFSQIIDEDEDDALLPIGKGNLPKKRMAIRTQRVYAVPIEDVQQLPRGHVALITGGHYARVQVYPLAIPADLMRAAIAFVSSPPFMPPPAAIPTPPPVPSTAKKTQRQAAQSSQGLGKQSPSSPPSPAVPTPPPAPTALQPSLPSPSAQGSSQPSVLPPVPPAASPIQGEDILKETEQKPASDQEDDSPVDFFS